MNSRPQTPALNLAFTLVELLTVIAIIAILMGLLFPAIGVVKEQARKAEAKTACANIVAAVKAYNTEYGKYPVGDATATGDLAMGGESGKDNANLFFILRAKDGGTNTGHKYNPRRIVFFEGKAASSTTAPKGGFSEPAGVFYDPWGGQYGIVIDADYDNEIKAPHTDFTTAVQTGCLTYAMGKDQKTGTAGDKKYKSGGNTSDDVISWQ